LCLKQNGKTVFSACIFICSNQAEAEHARQGKKLSEKNGFDKAGYA